MLCVATAVLLRAQGGPVQSKSRRFASWDEMNVLAHGLLQLGQGLREHAERTRSQLNALERRLSACGSACQGTEGSTALPLAPESRVDPEVLHSLQVRAPGAGSPRPYWLSLLGRVWTGVGGGCATVAPWDSPASRDGLPFRKPRREVRSRLGVQDHLKQNSETPVSSQKNE